MALAAVLLSAPTVHAEQFGLFTFAVVNGSSVTITGYPKDATGEVLIPAEINGRPVASISWGAFSGCTGLTRITIPASVTSIGGDAFSNCTGLTSIQVEPGNPSYASEDGVLFNADKMTVVVYPGGKEGGYTIPASVANIGSYAFYGCNGLSGVTIGEGVTSIGSYAFYGCTGLTGLTLEDGLTAIGRGVFSNCTGLKSIAIPAGVTRISNGLFEGCTGLTSVTIPESVTSIGEDAFYGCTGLKNVTIPNSVTSIDEYAFGGCTGLESIAIPASVIHIGSDAFSGCTGLTSVTIGEGVTHISGSAFFGLTGLTSIHVETGNPSYASEDGVLFDADKMTLVAFPGGKEGGYTIPDSVANIGSYAFSGCTGLTSVTIPASVSSIDGSAFSGCTGLTSVTLQEGLTAIGTGMFEDCTGLTSVTIPSSVTSIGYGAFSGCSGLTAIHVEPGNPNYTSEDGVLFNPVTTALILCPEGKYGAYSIPASVTSIGDRAFRNCVGLTSMTVPGSVTSIGGSAFSGCTGLTSVTIPSSVTSIGYGAFSGCTGLTGVTIPASVSSIDGYAFWACTGLKVAMFLGNAPARFGYSSSGDYAPFSVFANTSPDFSIYYLSGRFGFTSPTWNDYPAVMLDAVPSPGQTWLLGYGLPLDADLAQDLNGDGVPLLMAYALRLDPRENLAGRLPAPEVTGDAMSLTFPGDIEGVTYVVETTTDLRNWGTEGVAMSDPNGQGNRTASVIRTNANRYLRLVVGQ